MGNAPEIPVHNKKEESISMIPRDISVLDSTDAGIGIGLDIGALTCRIALRVSTGIQIPLDTIDNDGRKIYYVTKAFDVRQQDYYDFIEEYNNWMSTNNNNSDLNYIKSCDINIESTCTDESSHSLSSDEDLVTNSIQEEEPKSCFRENTRNGVFTDTCTCSINRDDYGSNIKTCTRSKHNNCQKCQKSFDIYYIEFDSLRVNDFCKTKIFDWMKRVLRKNDVFKFTGVGSGLWRLEAEAKDNASPLSGIIIDRHKESFTTSWGVFFVSRIRPCEYFTFHGIGTKECLNTYVDDTERLPELPVGNARMDYPYLLVSIKSGTSFFLVKSPTKIKRLSGSPIGAASLVGIASTIMRKEENRLRNSSFKDNITGIFMETHTDEDQVISGHPIDYCRTTWRLISSAVEKSTSSVDLLVSDVYGGDYSSIGLSGNTLASLLGKASPSVSDNRMDLNRRTVLSDVSQSLIRMIFLNTCHLSYLHSSLLGVNLVVFTGYITDLELSRTAYVAKHQKESRMDNNIINDKSVTVQRKVSDFHRRLLMAMQGSFNAWSGGSLRAHFLLNCRHVAALGALLVSDSVERDSCTTLEEIKLDAQVSSFQISTNSSYRKRKSHNHGNRI